MRSCGLPLLAICSCKAILGLIKQHGAIHGCTSDEIRVLLLPLMGDEKLCDGLSEARVVAVVQASTYSACAAYHSGV